MLLVGESIGPVGESIGPVGESIGPVAMSQSETEMGQVVSREGGSTTKSWNHQASQPIVESPARHELHSRWVLNG